MSDAVTQHANPLLASEVMLNLSNGVDEALQTMARVVGVFEKSFLQNDWTSPCEVSSYLEVQSLPIKGQIRFHFPLRVLSELYKKMLNEVATPSIAEAIDCLGEFSNVSYGHAKGKLNRVGYSLGMALPHPGKTDEMPIVSSIHPHLVVPFKIFNETCYIQIVIL